MQRQPKKLEKSELLDRVYKELGIDPSSEAQLICPLYHTPEFVPLTYCMEKCNDQCRDFYNFQFVFDQCYNDGCTSLNPCSSCVVEIEKYKTLLQCIRACVGGFDGRRYYGMVKRRNHAKERLKCK